MRRVPLVAGCVLLAVWIAASPAAQAPFDIRASYTKTEHMIPMRDGVKLFTIVYAPKDQSQTYPFMLHRTPYGSPPYGAGHVSRRRSVRRPAFAKEGFIFVYQDVRGKFRVGRRVRRHAADQAGAAAARRRPTRAPTPTTRSTGW